MRVHAYFIRLVRSNETEKNEKIHIFSIFCKIAKAQGKQYTKRILPFFVISECNITLDNVLDIYRRFPEGKIDYEKASWLTGAYDNRTIKKHYERIKTILEKTTMRLAEYLSSIPSFTALPSPTPVYDQFELMILYIQIFDLAGTGMRGEAKGCEPIVIIAKTYFEEKARNPVYRPLDYVSYLLHFHDTS